MPRTEFYCFHVTGAPKLFFFHPALIWSLGRRKYLLEPVAKPRNVGARVLGMP